MTIQQLALLTGVLLLAVAPVSTVTAQAGPATVRIIDGDSVEIAGERIRLHGIDAPELLQSCDGWPAGHHARQRLVELLIGGVIEIDRKDRDRYGRTVARLRVVGPGSLRTSDGEPGLDVNATMVADGMAFMFARYSRAYEAQERQAAAARLGVHGHGCEAPEAYRARQRGAR